MKLWEWAQGKWPEIISRLVGEQYTNTRKHCPCPKGEGMDRFRFSDRGGSGNYFCACSDGSKTGIDLLKCVHGWDFKMCAREIETVIGKPPADANGVPVKRGPTYAERLRESAEPSSRSRYLESRGLEVAPGLLFHPAVDYYDPEGKLIRQYPAMLAPLMRDEKFLTFHATYLENGSKAPVAPCKKILPGPPNSGAACRLYPCDGEVGIAEGVETAIAAKMHFGVPVWAALNAPLLAAFEPPAQVKVVMIFADHDSNYAGHKAAYTLAHRLVQKGVKVEIEIPPDPDTDWNDVLLKARQAA